jgi:hypothetical protein
VSGRKGKHESEAQAALSHKALAIALAAIEGVASGLGGAAIEKYMSKPAEDRPIIIIERDGSQRGQTPPSTPYIWEQVPDGNPPHDRYSIKLIGDRREKELDVFASAQLLGATRLAAGDVAAKPGAETVPISYNLPSAPEHVLMTDKEALMAAVERFVSSGQLGKSEGATWDWIKEIQITKHAADEAPRVPTLQPPPRT